MRWLCAFAVLAGLVGACSSTTADESSPLPEVVGRVAYSFEGDIYVGDLSTGESERITDDPESDINPIFSPDGARIAFIRGTPIRGPASLIVVEADGSDPRVVIPEGFTGATGGEHGPGPFAWTPDGGAIVVEIDSPPLALPVHDGELMMFDAAGAGEPRLLVPPLQASVGALYFNPSAQIAPMFRPPAGDLILNPRDGVVEVFDADLTLVDTMEIRHLRVEGDSTVVWSPDGTKILVTGDRYDASTEEWLYNEGVVIDSETGELLHSLGVIGGGVWSPDGTKLAFTDRQASDDLPSETRLAVYDLTSGEWRVLESSVSPLKRGARVLTITSNVAHDWYYEGVTWSPDGRSLLILKDHLTRPFVIDVITDTATELPWATDSFPTWRPTP